MNLKSYFSSPPTGDQSKPMRSNISSLSFYLSEKHMVPHKHTEQVAAEFQREVQRWEGIVEMIEKELKASERRKALLNRTCTVIQSELNALDDRIVQLTQRLGMLESESNELIRQMRPLRNALESSRRKATVLANQISDAACESYSGGSEGPKTPISMGMDQLTAEQQIVYQLETKLELNESKINERLSEIENTSKMMCESINESSQQKKNLVVRYRSILRREDLITLEISEKKQKIVSVRRFLKIFEQNAINAIENLEAFSKTSFPSHSIVVQRNIKLFYPDRKFHNGLLLITPALFLFEPYFEFETQLLEDLPPSVQLKTDDFVNGVIEKSEDTATLYLLLKQSWKDLNQHKSSSIDWDSVQLRGSTGDILLLWEGENGIKNLLTGILQSKENILSNSKILDVFQFNHLLDALPGRFHYGPWSIAYSLNHDGMSIQQLYRKCSRHNIAVLIIKDETGDIFGAFLTSSLLVHHKYFGTAESFVFSLTPELKVYRSTSKNEFHMLCHKDSFSIGGGYVASPCSYTIDHISQFISMRDSCVDPVVHAKPMPPLHFPLLLTSKYWILKSGPFLTMNKYFFAISSIKLLNCPIAFVS